MRATQVYAAVQRTARARQRPVNEMLTLYGLERFLARLSTTRYSQDFALKGGVLLATFNVRRPTRDIDMQALDFALDETHLLAVVSTVAQVEAEDGLVLHSDQASTEIIRDDDEYNGIRVTVPAAIAQYTFNLRLDVSTGDPIVPEPEPVALTPILGGEPVRMLGHPLPMVVAEKTVTMLQRGTTSTRWRDLYDVGQIARHRPLIAQELADAASAVASHRGLPLTSVSRALQGYGAVGQAKWRAWLHKWELADGAEDDLEDQATLVARFVDPVFTGSVSVDSVWSPDECTWT